MRTCRTFSTPSRRSITRLHTVCSTSTRHGPARTSWAATSAWARRWTSKLTFSNKLGRSLRRPPLFLCARGYGAPLRKWNLSRCFSLRLLLRSPALSQAIRPLRPSRRSMSALSLIRKSVSAKSRPDRSCRSGLARPRRNGMPSPLRARTRWTGARTTIARPVSSGALALRSKPYKTKRALRSVAAPAVLYAAF